MIRVQPDEGATIRFGSKVPGTQMEVRDVTMDFGYGHSFTESSPEAYERLILDVLLGEPPLFPRHAEVELSWKILDPFEDYWAGLGRTARALRARKLGPRLRRRAACPRRTNLEKAMIVDLPDTTTSKISKKIMALREQGGVIALGRVLTLVVVTKSGLEEEAIEAANEASREHPCRIIVLADAGAAAPTRLDAQIRVGGDAGASEVILLRGYGELAEESESLVAALLLPDAPIVAWWPHGAPKNACETSIGRIAHRRITDSANETDPQAALENIRRTYKAGDTDLAWTRLTNWRIQLAAVLDQVDGSPGHGRRRRRRLGLPQHHPARGLAHPGPGRPGHDRRGPRRHRHPPRAAHPHRRRRPALPARPHRGRTDPARPARPAHLPAAPQPEGLPRRRTPPPRSGRSVR